MPLPDDESSIWTEAIECFEKQKITLCRLVMGEPEKIEELKDGDTWDTCLNR